MREKKGVLRENARERKRERIQLQSYLHLLEVHPIDLSRTYFWVDDHLKDRAVKPPLNIWEIIFSNAIIHVTDYCVLFCNYDQMEHSKR